MDYEKKYKEALERAKHALDCDRNNLVSTDIPLIYSMFPELKESEDERIRKAIHIYLDWLDGRKDYAPKGEYSIKDMVAWLEKQGESYTKKDVDNAFVEGMTFAKNELEKQGTKPKEATLTYEAEVGNGNIKGLITEKLQLSKFHEGEWIVNREGETAHIVEVRNDFHGTLRYYIEWANGSKSDPMPCFIDNDFHLWTIQDAKDGDVLAWDDSKCIALFKNIFDEDSFISHGCVGHCTGVFEAGWSYHDIEGAHPATKEQRDTLEKAMANAGYTFGFEKKVLKKIEQKQ